MHQSAVFVSYRFKERGALLYLEVLATVLKTLPRVRKVDGNSLNPLADFSGVISDFIRKDAKALVAIFSGQHDSKANIVYEIGVAVGAGIPVILIADSLESIPAMLRGHDILVSDVTDPRDARDFKSRLERKLRITLQAPDDHLIEEKIHRRYSEEETRHFLNHESLVLPIDCIRAGDLKKAEAILRDRLEDDPANIDVHFLLADTLYLIGCSDKHPQHREDCFTEQIAVSLRGLQLDPHSVLCFFSLSTGRLRLGNFKEMRASLSQLMSLDADFSPGHYSWACLHSILGDKPAMLGALSAAIQLHQPWRSFARGDPDFRPYWQDADWQGLVY